MKVMSNMCLFVVFYSKKFCIKNYCMLKSLAFKDFAFSYFIIFESRGLGVNLLINNHYTKILTKQNSLFCVFYYIISYSCICCRDMSDIEFR